MVDVPEPTTKYKKFATGWLAPDGKFYPCEGAWEHYNYACALLKQFYPNVSEQIDRDFRAREDDALQERGWIRVGATLSYNFGFVIWVKPTQRQIDVIWDYCKARKAHLPNLEVVE